MKSVTNQRKFRRKRHLSFDPNREYIENAVEDYLKNGGKIKVLEAQKDSQSAVDWIASDDNLEADEFLSE